MQIQTASQLLEPLTQKAVVAALNSGVSVTIPIAKPGELPNLRSYLNSVEAKDLQMQYSQSGLAGTHVVTLDSSSRQTLKAAGLTFSPEAIALGAGSGALVGTGVGLLINTLRTVAPKSTAALTIGCAIIGTGLGGALGARLCEIGLDLKTGEVTLKPTPQKA